MENKEIELEIKLHINNRLYETGNITKEMYNKAKEMIYKTCKITKNVVVCN